MDLLSLPASQPPAQSLVVILHGYGADAADLFPLAKELQPALPHTAFVALNAPAPCEANPGGRQWFTLFDIESSERSGALTYWPMEKLAAVGREAADILNGWLDQLLGQYALPAKKMALVGFSQGCMMALHVGLRRKQQIGGIVGLSGRLLQPETLVKELASRPPVLLRHGDADSVVPPYHLNEAVRVLENMGVPVDATLEPGLDHGISGAALADTARFLQGVL